MHSVIVSGLISNGNGKIEKKLVGFSKQIANLFPKHERPSSPWLHSGKEFNTVTRLQRISCMNSGRSTNFDFDEIVDRRSTRSLKWDRYKDQDVVPLWVADMDFRACPAIIEAIKERIDHGVFGYTIPDHEVKDVVLRYLKDHHRWEAQREWLYFLPGVVQGLNLACRLFDPCQDNPVEVLVPSPVYGPFLTAPLHSGHRCVKVPLVRGPVEGTEGKRVDWTFDWEALEEAISPRTKLILLCNPHNPVGRVFMKAELVRLGEFCLKHDLIICSDEIHSDLIFDPSATPHIPMATISQEISDRTITLQSPSKTYNIPSMGLAYAVIPNKQLRLRFMKAGRGLVTQMPAVGYTSLQAAYEEGGPWHQALLTYLDGNRQFLYEYIGTHLPQLKIYPMEATYLAWIDVSALNLPNPWQFFNQAGVGLSNGQDFGATEPFLRINFGCPRSVLKEGLNRIQSAIIRQNE